MLFFRVPEKIRVAIIKLVNSVILYGRTRP